jgi:hypothetical protein
MKKRKPIAKNSPKLPYPWKRKLTEDDRRRYFMLCECLASELKDNECLVDCLYRLLADRRQAFQVLAETCIQPGFKFVRLS